MTNVDKKACANEKITAQAGRLSRRVRPRLSGIFLVPIWLGDGEDARPY